MSCTLQNVLWNRGQASSLACPPVHTQDIEGSDTVKFKLKMIPPTATAQQKGEMIIGGRIHHYKKRNVAAAEAILRDALLPYIPKEPADGPISLWVCWMFPYPKSAKKHQPGWSRAKITRPDGDNLNKMLKDVMTDMGFWKDDALIYSELVQKVYSDEPGIVIDYDCPEHMDTIGDWWDEDD